MKKNRHSILVINGPNLNMLGVREKSFYGNETLESINKRLSESASKIGIDIDFFQNNSEGNIIDRIHQAFGKTDMIIINPAAYTHTSVAIRDALLAVKIPVIEVHLSNIYTREEFRHHSYISPIAKGVISGFGAESYQLALHAAVGILKKSEQ